MCHHDNDIYLGINDYHANWQCKEHIYSYLNFFKLQLCLIFLYGFFAFYSLVFYALLRTNWSSQRSIASISKYKSVPELSSVYSIIINIILLLWCFNSLLKFRSFLLWLFHYQIQFSLGCLTMHDTLISGIAGSLSSQRLS